jgi:hypothetical protein
MLVRMDPQAMRQDRLVIVLADISGYTRFMVENRLSAVHGQLCINWLIEALLEQVDIPLTLQEIEGDAVFLYARDPGSDEGWQATLQQVCQKLPRFFDAFIARTGYATETTPCGCAICRNSDQLGLKIVVHIGEAVFHELAGKAQVSGADVILAHRLLKNSVPFKEYLLLSGPTFDLLGHQLPGDFEAREEDYEGFGRVPIRMRSLEREFLAARDAVYRLSEEQLKGAVDGYLGSLQRGLPPAALQQMRSPIRPFGWRERLGMLWDAWVGFRLTRGRLRAAIPAAQRARGERRTEWTGRPAEGARI